MSYRWQASPYRPSARTPAALTEPAEMTADLEQKISESARAAVAKRASPFLNTAQAAFFVGLSPRTLERMRLEDRGPCFRKHGRQVRYHIQALEDWSKGLAGHGAGQEVGSDAYHDADKSDDGHVR